jgi:splicing factor 3B subunit 4
MKVMNMVKLYSKAIKVNKAAQDKKAADVGANIFVGNLDSEVDEKQLYDTFVAFGPILTTPHIMRDPDTGMSKGYGFISFDSFEASDLAIDVMNGQYLANRPIVCQYAFKKDTPGERHGSQAERLLASQSRAARPLHLAGPETTQQQQAPAGHMYNPLMGAPMMMPPAMNLPMYMAPPPLPTMVPPPPPPPQFSVPQPPPPPGMLPPPPPVAYMPPPPPPSN